MLIELDKGTKWLSLHMQVFSHTAMSNNTQKSNLLRANYNISFTIKVRKFQDLAHS